MNIETIIKFLNALIPISITILGTYIAYQQWLTNERKRKQDLFELRRKYIYSKTLNLIHNVPSIAKDILNAKLDSSSPIISYTRYYAEYNFLISVDDSQKLEILYYDIMRAINHFSEQGLENFADSVKAYEQNTKDELKQKLNDLLEKYLRIENDSISFKIKRILNNFLKKKYR